MDLWLRVVDGHFVNDIGDVGRRHRQVWNVENGSIVIVVELENEIVVVRENQSISGVRVVGDLRIIDPFTEFGNEIDVFDVVAVIFETKADFLLDVFVE
nr:hypothetical protein [Natronolimnohabitans innermongolicus]